jgi:hypothetical protein
MSDVKYTVGAVGSGFGVDATTTAGAVASVATFFRTPQEQPEKARRAAANRDSRGNLFIINVFLQR